MTEREKRNDNIIIGIIIGVVLYSIVLHLAIHVFNVPVRQAYLPGFMILTLKTIYYEFNYD